MQLGKTLVGALLGAALGIGLLVVVYLLFGLDQAWLAIGVALLTGLGVRMMVATSGRASYARGALTGVIALAAYVVGWLVVAKVATEQTTIPPRESPRAVAEQPAEEPAETDEPLVEEPTAEAPPVAQTPNETAPELAIRRNAPGARNFSKLDFIWLSIAALLAYELGRGTGATAPGGVSTDESEADPALSRDEPPGAVPPEVVRPPD